MPSDPARAETLPELLAALERSGNLRSLARECGLTVKELRRRLEGWRRELLADPGAAGAPRARPEAAGGGEREALLSLRFGSIAITIHEDRVVQIDVTEKKRLRPN